MGEQPSFQPGEFQATDPDTAEIHGLADYQAERLLDDIAQRNAEVEAINRELQAEQEPDASDTAKAA
jgi:hypothetical protein